MYNQPITAYLAPLDYLAQVKGELSNIIECHDRLVIAKGTQQPSYWSQNIWLKPEIIKFESIKDASEKLLGLGKLWSLYSFKLHRRASLIQDKLPRLRQKPLTFPHKFTQELKPIGSWTLLDENTILAAPNCTSPYPNGDLFFVEDHINPPSRAYLKLFEALTRIQRWPDNNSRCLELGASPGGWTWVLDLLGAHVVAVDRSPLADPLMRKKNIEFRKGDAFSITPNDFGTCHWLLSDLICYPDKLYDYVMSWLESGKCQNFICTLKFQGSEHYGAIEKFARIPNSQIVHLTHNKHELTWIKFS